MRLTRTEFETLVRRVEALEQVLSPDQRRQAGLIEQALFVVAVAEGLGQLVEVIADAASEA